MSLLFHVYTCLCFKKTKSSASQLSCGEVGRLLQRSGICETQASLEGSLSFFPLCHELANGALALGAQNPSPLTPIISRSGPRQARLLDMSQSPRRRRLVDPDELCQLGGRQVRRPDHHLQRRELRQRNPAITQHRLVERGGRPGGLA